MKILKSMSGMLTVEFTSAAPEKILDAVTQARIPLSHVVQKNELTYQLFIRRRDYRQLRDILRKQGGRLDIIRKEGAYWTAKSLFHRPMLLAMFLFLLCSSFYWPTRIYFVTVEGNTTVPDRQILSAAEACGIRFGASRKLVRSEKVKNALLCAVPQLQWAGVNTSGCAAVISVRERVEEEQPKEERIVSNLIAARDGYILSATITNGSAHVQPGETVTKGQLLISGYTDCGICIRASRAEGEVLAQTKREMNAVMPAACVFQGRILQTKCKVSLILGKKRINLWKDSRISGTVCGRMYEEYFVSLPGGFQLPLAICIDRYLNCEMQEAAIPETEAMIQLQQFSEAYMFEQMVAGRFIQKQQEFTCQDGLYRLQNSYTCEEMIGLEQREQIGVINGKGN